MKRVVEDAKGLLAFDRATGTETLDSNAYLLRAVEGVALNKKRYAEAEAGARRQGRAASNFADVFSMHNPGEAIAFNSGWTSTD